MNSTRHDGMPTPDPDTYRLLVVLTWLAVPTSTMPGNSAPEKSSRTSSQGSPTQMVPLS